MISMLVAASTLALLSRYQRCVGWRTENFHRSPEVNIANACIGRTSGDNAYVIILSASQT